jgi:hypothetical protein
MAFDRDGRNCKSRQEAAAPSALLRRELPAGYADWVRVKQTLESIDARAL